MVAVHLVVLRHQSAGLRRGRADDPAPAGPGRAAAGHAAHGRVLLRGPVRGGDAVPADDTARPLCRRRLARPDGRRAADGPVRGCPGRVAGVQRAAAHAVAAAAAHRRRLRLPDAGAVRGARGDRRRVRRGTGGAGRRMVDPGRPGHPAPPPLHGPRDPQPAGPHRRDLRRRTHPDRHGPDPHRAAGPAARRRAEPAAHAEPAGAELRRHDRRHAAWRPAGPVSPGRWASRWPWSRWCCC